MIYSRRVALAALLAISGCADQTAPTASPSIDESASATGAATSSTQEPERGRHERLARRLAMALRDADLRTKLARAFRSSPFKEGKVYLQDFMAAGRGDERKRLAARSGDAEAAVGADLAAAAPIEIYLPVPEHRRRWNGEANIMVVTVERDDDVPVGYDVDGSRIVLDRHTPPGTPVISLVRAETRFDRVPDAAGCIFLCGGGGGSGGSTPAPNSGLYLTRTRFDGTFEGWPKGSPEFEVHVLGQVGQGDSLTTYGCAGEKSPAPYFFDQDDMTWSGSALLMSQAQIDEYKRSHPNQNLRIFVVEDDDTSCQIKMDTGRLANLLNSLKITYGSLTGGIDSTKNGPTGVLQRWWKGAQMLLVLFKAGVSLIQTQDDPVGNAVADSVPASNWFPGANWLVRGESNVVHGAIRVEVR